MPDQSETPDRLARLIDAERLKREGPTLKNVAENMRTIAVMVAMFIATGVLFEAPYIWVNGLAILWGAWTLFYAVLAAFQAGLLFALALFNLPGLSELSRKPSWLGKAIANSLAAVAVLFMVATAFILTTSILSVSHGR